jgi:hypothetical protein
MVFASCIDVTPNASDVLLLLSPYFTVDDEPEKDEMMDSSDYVDVLLPAVVPAFSSNWWYCEQPLSIYYQIERKRNGWKDNEQTMVFCE